MLLSTIFCNEHVWNVSVCPDEAWIEVCLYVWVGMALVQQARDDASVKVKQ